MSPLLVKHERYSFRRRKRYKWLPFDFCLTWNEYDILFEEGPIRTWTGNEETVKEIVNLLNCAYDMGNLQARAFPQDYTEDVFPDPFDF